MSAKLPVIYGCDCHYAEEYLASTMQELIDRIRTIFQGWIPEEIPSLSQLVNAMDPVAWTLVILLLVAIGVGLYLTLSTRRFFFRTDDVETTPELLLARLKQDPSRLSPVAIVSRIGAEATLELLDYGDQIQTKEWRYRWSAIREELLQLLSGQNAFGPVYALARYYRSQDRQEPDTLRIRRTVLVHKLGVLRHLEADSIDHPSQLRIRHHPAEIEGDLGFDGDVFWLLPDEPVSPPHGPVVEMEPIDFQTINDAEVKLHIRRTPTVGGGFRLRLQKRRNMWVVVDEEIEWVN
ncbi:MAG: hypothetical protein R2867_42740 [Caldilineaceae bacterium]